MKMEICMLCRSWTEDIDPTGWLMSEKFNGIRMIRPRGNLDLFSREGNAFNPPGWWRDMLPRGIFLDGEAFISYGQFQHTQSILEKKQATDDEWRHVTFRCIEPCWLPGTKMQINAVFKPIVQVVCKGREHLREFYDAIIESGGEGIVIRHPNQAYHVGRSPYLLRVKPELKGSALVAGYNFKDGKLVSLKCQYFVGRTQAEQEAEMAAALREGRNPNPVPPICFNIANGLSAETRGHPPMIGVTINYTYQCKSSNGTPIFARLERPR